MLQINYVFHYLMPTIFREPSYGKYEEYDHKPTYKHKNYEPAYEVEHQ